jgi:hypothetical protein
MGQDAAQARDLSSQLGFSGVSLAQKLLIDHLPGRSCARRTAEKMIAFAVALPPLCATPTWLLLGHEKCSSFREKCFSIPFALGILKYRVFPVSA